LTEEKVLKENFLNFKTKKGGKKIYFIRQSNKKEADWDPQ